jgi:hypothetical protein
MVAILLTFKIIIIIIIIIIIPHKLSLYRPVLAFKNLKLLLVWSLIITIFNQFVVKIRLKRI